MFNYFTKVDYTINSSNNLFDCLFWFIIISCILLIITGVFILKKTAETYHSSIYLLEILYAICIGLLFFLTIIFVKYFIKEKNLLENISAIHILENLLEKILEHISENITITDLVCLESL